MSFETSRTSRCHRTLGLFLLLLVSSVGWGMATAPPDTSSPRATFQSSLTLTSKLAERYAAYQSDTNGETLRALLQTVDQGQYLTNLDEVAPAARREVAADSVALIWDLLARVELPKLEDIPDAAACGDDGPLAHQPPKWRLPGTGIVIRRVDEGPQAGEFLFSAQTIASMDRCIEATRDLPYVRQEPVADLSAAMLRFSGWMLPPRWVEKLPEWTQQPIAGQVVCGSGF